MVRRLTKELGVINLGCSIRILIALLVSACGVEAGNPDSTEEKKGFINFSITDAPIDDVDRFMISLDRLEFGNDRTLQVDLGLDDPLDLLSLANGKKLKILTEQEAPVGEYTQFYLILANTDQAIEAIKTDGSSAKVVILDASGKISNELAFSGSLSLSEGESSNLIVDVDLRQTLSLLTEEQRSTLDLDASYEFVIRQDHSFHSESEVGAIEVEGYDSGSLICVVKAEAYTSESLPKDCSGENSQSTIVDADNFAKILAIRPDSYSVFQVFEDSVSLIEEQAVITKGNTLTIGR